MENNENHIVIIGAGNVATNLVNALRESGNFHLSIYGRNPDDVKLIANKYALNVVLTLADIPSSTSLILICVSDNSIDNILEEIKNKEVPIAHTSGGISMEVFKNHQFSNYGVFYPLQSLSKMDVIDFDNVPICIEYSNDYTRDLLKSVAINISKNVHEINSDNRATLHLAAVFANNFTNHLYEISKEILTNEKLSFELLRPLIERTAKKVMKNDPITQQTGPAWRNDQNTISKHRNMIKNDQLLLIYDLFSKRIEQLKKESIEE